MTTAAPNGAAVLEGCLERFIFVSKASSAVVGRLRLDGKVMDMATFAALVLRGDAPPT